MVDVGVAADLARPTGLLPRKVRARHRGHDASGPAMTREEALRGVEVGIETARRPGRRRAAGCCSPATWASPTPPPSAALIAAFTGADPAEVTGRGTGIDDETHARKVERRPPRRWPCTGRDPADPLGVLAAVGGLEHAALAGLHPRRGGAARSR